MVTMSMVSALLMGTIQESIFGPLLLPILKVAYILHQHVPAHIIIKYLHHCCNLFLALLEMITSVTQAVRLLAITYSIQMTPSGMVRAVDQTVPAAASTLLRGSLKPFPPLLLTILS